MIRSLLLLLAVALVAEQPDFELIPSTPDQIATLRAEEPALIGGVLSPLSGQITLRKTDLTSKGAQDVSLTRLYIAPHVAPPASNPHSGWESFWEFRAFYGALAAHYRGWTFLPHLYAVVYGGVVRFTDRNGSTLDFRIDDSALLTPIYGISNSSHETPSGTFDPRNIRIQSKEGCLLIAMPDASVLHYVQVSNGYRYVLQKEILPNGKVLRYSYEKGLPVLLQSLDPKEQVVYASISLSGLNMEGALANERFCSESLGKDAAQYQGYRHTVRDFYKKKHNEAEYGFSCPLAITSANSPTYRSDLTGYTSYMQLENYSGRQGNFYCSYEPFASVLRVKTLSMPSGEKGKIVSVYQMDYDPPQAGRKGGSTTVKRIDGVKIIYQFSSELLTESIRTYQPDGKLAKEKKFTWDANHRLNAIESKDGDGTLFYRKEFEFDEFGNPAVERFIGDLTGEGIPETRTTLRDFSKDGRHLLLREETEEGKITSFSYLPGTNLPIAKYISSKNKILLREFCNYDDSNNLIEKMIDDGTAQEQDKLDDITERKITRYRLRTATPFLHMPEWVEEWYLEESVEKLLRKTHLSYDRRGYVELEKIYDSKEVLSYQIERETDEQGNVLWETDPLGHKTKTKYNASGLPTSSTNKSGNLEKLMHYDAQKRLWKLEEKGTDGLEHATTWTFDELDRCTKEVDYLSNPTSYTLDRISGKPRQIDGPPILSTDGAKVSVQTQSIYDAVAHKISDTDANGHTTTTRFNAYGSPIEIEYPDGSQETYRYYKNGDLYSHTDPDGSKIVYHWDLLGRLEGKEYGSVTTETKEYNSVATETFVYDALHLRSHTDRENHLTKWEYDRAGRKILEEKEGRTIKYTYDSLSLLASETHSHLRVIEYTRDAMNQIREERSLDPISKKILTKIGYNYDPDGNQTEVIRYPEDIQASETFTYDSFGRLSQHKDALGYLTTSTYDESQTNKLGQRVLTKRILDPNQITTVITYDPYHQQVSKQIGSLYTENQIFDSSRNLLQIEEQGLLTRYSYDRLNRTESLTRAFGTPQARTTSYTYTKAGKLKTKTLPSHTVLTYEYDLLGHPKSLSSSDRIISQTFKYSPLGNLLFASDNQHVIERELDAFGNILNETIDGKLSLAKTYDDLDRILSLTLPDQSSIRYTYDAAFLKTVTRYSANNIPLYTHAYTSYDQSGRLNKQQLIGGLGTITHHWNARGQPKSLASPHFNEDLEYDPGGRVVSISGQLFGYDDLSQITSESGSTYDYDAHFNRIEKNGIRTKYNSLDEVDESSVSYDLDGNLKNYGNRFYQYDPLKRLISAGNPIAEVRFTYDALARCQSKIIDGEEEFYLYQGTEELGAFSPDGSTKQLKVPGLDRKPIALEIHNETYAPLLDYRGNIRRLIDLRVGDIAETCDYTVFGEETISEKITCPWRYAAKRYDSDLGLYYFGKRWYAPELGRWLTTDPAGFVDGTNLYQYAFNNPLSYYDPNGESIAGYCLGIGQILLGGTLMLTGCILEVATFGGYTIGFGFQESAGLALITSGFSTAMYHSQDLSFTTRSGSYSGSYLPQGALGGACAFPAYQVNRKKIKDAVSNQMAIKKNSGERTGSDEPGSPPFRGDALGEDSAKCPEKGFEWKGQGSPSSGNGSWVRGGRKEMESLHPDFKNPDHDKHWDYQSPDHPKGARLYLDGTWEAK